MVNAFAHKEPPPFLVAQCQIVPAAIVSQQAKAMEHSLAQRGLSTLSVLHIYEALHLWG